MLEKFAYCIDENGKKYHLDCRYDKDGAFVARLDKEQLKSAEQYNFMPELFRAKVNDEGYYLYSVDGVHLTYFTEREDVEFVSDGERLPVFGACIHGKSYLGIVTGMDFSYVIVVGKKGDSYYFYPRFLPKTNPFYHDLEVRLYEIDGDYNKMAQIYRSYVIENNNVVPIKERKEKLPFVGYGAESPYIRIRMGWKPAPTDVPEQTEENEPPMHVACTFDSIKKLIDALKLKGVKKAEFCLVGWNCGGHDGRWPQAFPVDERFGGEEKLKELIRYTEDNGYVMSCHTNCWDAYTLADNYSDDFICIDREGKQLTGGKWSGGLARLICPVCAKKVHRELVDIKRVAKLGFKGLHYIDVLTSIRPSSCFSKDHPSGFEEGRAAYREIMAECRELFGGFSSEYGRAYAPDLLDNVYCVDCDNEHSPLMDERIPFWQLVYNGIIMSNPVHSCINAPVKDREATLRLLEYNGRPAYYLYKAFTKKAYDRGEHLLDLTLDNDEQIERTAEAIAKGYREFVERMDLQQVFMTKYEKLCDGVSAVSYENGACIVVNRSENEYIYRGKVVKPHDYEVVR